jgi:hypothetical protein
MHRYIVYCFLNAAYRKSTFLPAMHISFCVSGDSPKTAKTHAKSEMASTFPRRTFLIDSVMRVEYHDDG